MIKEEIQKILLVVKDQTSVKVSFPFSVKSVFHNYSNIRWKHFQYFREERNQTNVLNDRKHINLPYIDDDYLRANEWKSYVVNPKTTRRHTHIPNCRTISHFNRRLAILKLPQGVSRSSVFTLTPTNFKHLHWLFLLRGQNKTQLSIRLYLPSTQPELTKIN